MPVISQDVRWYYTGDSPSDTGEPRNSFKAFSTRTALQPGVNNLFLGLTAEQNTAHEVRYRNFVIANTSPDSSSLTSAHLRVFASDFDPTGTLVAVALDPLYGILGSPAWVSRPLGGEVATTVADEMTNPGIGTWIPLTNSADTDIELPNIRPNEGVVVWVRRSAQGSGGNPDQDFSLTLIGTTEV